MNGSVVQLQLDSRALKGNPLGDPSARTMPVYLPPGYGESAERYPVAYFLHGFTGTGAGWTNVSGFAPNTLDRLDRLISDGLISPIIAVFVDGWTKLGGSQWVNSAAIGRYRDYLAQDVVRAADRAFRTVPRNDARAVIGHSSGGYGALVMGRHHPELFGHIACHSGDAYFEYCYLPDFPKAAGVLLRSGGLEPWIAEFWRAAQETKVRSEDFPVINAVAMAAAYSPKPGLPLGVELPFDPETARLRPEVWDRWLAHDPVRFVPEGMASIRRLSSLFVDCGTRDEFHLRWGARMIAQALSVAGVDAVFEEFEDGHSGVSYRYERSLAYLGPRMARG